jgi:hypothetical protein
MKESEELIKPESQHFIEQAIAKNLRRKNGVTHSYPFSRRSLTATCNIGHARQYALDFGMAEKYGFGKWQPFVLMIPPDKGRC